MTENGGTTLEQLLQEKSHRVVAHIQTIRSLEEELRIVRSESAQKVATLEGKLASLQRRLDEQSDAVERLAQSEQRRRRLEEDVEASELHITELQEQLEARGRSPHAAESVRRRCAQLERELIDSTAALEAARSRPAPDADGPALRRRCAQLERQLQDSQADAKRSEAAVAALTSDLSRREKVWREDQQRLSRFEEERRVAELRTAKLAEALAENVDRWEEGKQRERDLLKRAERLEAELKNSESSQADGESLLALEAAEHRCEEAAEAQRAAESKVEQLSGMIRSHREQASGVAVQLTQLQEERGEFERQAERAAQELDTLQADKALDQNAILNLSAAQERSSNEIADLRNQLDAQQVASRKRAERLLGEVDKLRRENDALLSSSRGGGGCSLSATAGRDVEQLRLCVDRATVRVGHVLRSVSDMGSKDGSCPAPDSLPDLVRSQLLVARKELSDGAAAAALLADDLRRSRRDAPSRSDPPNRASTPIRQHSPTPVRRGSGSLVGMRTQSPSRRLSSASPLQRHSSLHRPTSSPSAPSLNHSAMTAPPEPRAGRTTRSHSFRSPSPLQPGRSRPAHQRTARPREGVGGRHHDPGARIPVRADSLGSQRMSHRMAGER
eukprot:TRINITY_DN13756_c0_g2_i1.p1 TRINITY_DN13756_c0_g2~~TRINITY_DN13756_c0_g2_i1.p1  ORF type:complete len:618 (+),score=120.74 TRINITY_DN13756_c0_g2_i1:80-1933(+)